MPIFYHKSFWWTIWSFGSAKSHELFFQKKKWPVSDWKMVELERIRKNSKEFEQLEEKLTLKHTHTLLKRKSKLRLQTKKWFFQINNLNKNETASKQSNYCCWPAKWTARTLRLLINCPSRLLREDCRSERFWSLLLLEKARYFLCSCSVYYDLLFCLEEEEELLNKKCLARLFRFEVYRVSVQHLCVA